MHALRDMLKNLTEVRKTAILLFVGLSACYLSLSPGSIAGQGYVGEEIQSGLRMLAVVNAWLKGLPIPQMEWSRHGPVPVLFDLPFIKLGKIFVSHSFVLCKRETINRRPAQCRKNGSSCRTRTYNPPVNSCTDGKTANYRQLRLFLKIRLLRHFQERLSAANIEGDSLKKSPKYFWASARAPTLDLERA